MLRPLPWVPDVSFFLLVTSVNRSPGSLHASEAFKLACSKLNSLQFLYNFVLSFFYPKSQIGQIRTQFLDFSHLLYFKWITFNFFIFHIQSATKVSFQFSSECSAFLVYPKQSVPPSSITTFRVLVIWSEVQSLHCMCVSEGPGRVDIQIFCVPYLWEEMSLRINSGLLKIYFVHSMSFSGEEVEVIFKVN